MNIKEETKENPDDLEKKIEKIHLHRPKKHQSFFQFKIKVDNKAKDHKDKKDDADFKNKEKKGEESEKKPFNQKFKRIMFAGLVGTLILSFIGDIFSDKNTITYFVEFFEFFAFFLIFSHFLSFSHFFIF